MEGGGGGIWESFKECSRVGSAFSREEEENLTLLVTPTLDSWNGRREMRELWELLKRSELRLKYLP